MAIRLSKIVKELNIGVSTAVYFLHSNGHNIPEDPNYKISDEEENLLHKEFIKDKDFKINVNEISQQRRMSEQQNNTTDPKTKLSKQQLVSDVFKLINSYNCSIKECFEDLKSMQPPDYHNNRSIRYESAWGGNGGTYPRNNAAQRDQNRIMYQHFISEKQDIKYTIELFKEKKKVFKEALTYLKSLNLIPMSLKSIINRTGSNPIQGVYKKFNCYEEELFNKIVEYLEFRNLDKRVETED